MADRTYSDSQHNEFNDSVFHAPVTIEQITEAKVTLEDERKQYNLQVEHDYHRNTRFCGRDEVLQRLKQGFEPTPKTLSGGLPRKVISLWGLGGVGKSQIALEYAYQFESTYTSIIWLKAGISTQAETNINNTILKIINHYAILSHYKTKGKADYKRIAASLQLHEVTPTREALLKVIANAATAKETFKTWLSQDMNKRWLLIVDGLDDPDALNLDEILPKNSCGHVIITTRIPDIEAGIPVNEKIPIEKLDLDSGVELLYRSAGIEREQKLSDSRHQVPVKNDKQSFARKIIEAVGGLPLAISVIGSFIKYNFRFSSDFKSYYEKYFKRGVRPEIFRYGSNTSQRSKTSAAETTDHTLETVWKTSFDGLDQEIEETGRNSSKKLQSDSQGGVGDYSKILLVLAYLGNEDIPYELIIENLNWIEDPESIHNALRRMVSLALVQEHANKRSCTIHPLVQQWLRNHSKDLKVETECVKLGMHMVIDKLVLDDTRESKNWQEELKILPHIQSCFENFRRYLETPSVPGRVAANETTLGNLDEETTNLACRLANVYWMHKDFEKAELLFKVVLSKGTLSFTNEKEETHMMNTLGLVLCARDEFEEALSWHGKALARSKHGNLTDSNFLALEIEYNIAEVKRQQGEYTSSQAEYQRILDELSRFEAENNPALENLHYKTLRGMATVLKDQCKYWQAMTSFKHALSVRQSKEREKPNPDMDHPDILETRQDIAVVLGWQGNHTAAIKEYETIYSSQKKVLGENHFDCLSTIHCIAEAHISIGAYDKALADFEKCLKGLLATFEEENSYTLLALDGIAYTYDCLGRYDDALKTYEAIYSRHRRMKTGIRGEFAAANDVARIQNKMGDYQKAIEGHKKAEEDQLNCKEMEENNHYILASTFGVASVLENQGKYEEALEIFQNVLEKEKTSYEDPNHISILKTEHSIARVYRKMGKNRQAVPKYDEILTRGKESKLEDDHPFMLEVRNGIGLALSKVDECQIAWKGLHKLLGLEHPLTLQAHCDVARLYCKQNKKRKQEALEIFGNAIPGLKRSLGEYHPITLDAQMGMANVLEKLGFGSEAKKLRQHVAISRAHNNPQQPIYSPLINKHMTKQFLLWGLVPGVMAYIAMKAVA